MNRKSVRVFFLSAVFSIMFLLSNNFLNPVTAQTLASSNIATMTLDHVALRVPNFEESVQWYKDNLGFTELVRWQAPPYIDPELEFAYLELNGFQLELAGGGNPIRGVPTPSDMQEGYSYQDYRHLCLRVDDMDATIAELNERGIELFAGPFVNDTLNRKFGHIKDNNDFWIELVEYLE